MKKLTCENCGEEFLGTQTDAEAQAEKDRLFPYTKIEDCDVVCDDCFNVIVVDPTKYE